MSPRRDAVRNLLLQSLEDDDFALLSGALEPVRLDRGQTPLRAGQEITSVTFIESGLVSISPRDGGAHAQAALVGREGMIGFTRILGDTLATDDSSVELPGSGLTMSAADLMQAASRSESLSAQLLCCVSGVLDQVTQSAAANAVLNAQQRLARWILMSADRIEGEELGVTHKKLSMLLGLRRATVTIAMQELEGDHLIKATRGLISVRDRDGLERLIGDYRPARALPYSPSCHHTHGSGATLSSASQRVAPVHDSVRDPADAAQASFPGLDPQHPRPAVFVAEDEYFIAADLQGELQSAGWDVVGPAPTLSEAQRLVASTPIDLAILDVNLAGEMVYPLADTLRENDTPFVFVTGYDMAIPARFDDVPRYAKPVAAMQIALVKQLGGPGPTVPRAGACD